MSIEKRIEILDSLVGKEIFFSDSLACCGSRGILTKEDGSFYFVGERLNPATVLSINQFDDTVRVITSKKHLTDRREFFWQDERRNVPSSFVSSLYKVQRDMLGEPIYIVVETEDSFTIMWTLLDFA